MKWDYHVPQTPLEEPRNKTLRNTVITFLSDISDSLGQVGTFPPKCLLHFATHIMLIKCSEEKVQESKTISKQLKFGLFQLRIKILYLCKLKC